MPVRGRHERRGWRTKTTTSATATTPHVITAGEVQPTMGPMLSTSMAAVTHPARLKIPTQSVPSQTPEPRRRRDRRPSAGDGTWPSSTAVVVEATAASPRVGNRRATTTEAMTRSTSCPQNRVRHPKNWITGDPSVTPSTGPPAPTSDHHPSALTRSWRENSSRMIAIDAVPVAAPCTPSRARAKSNIPTLGAVAVRIALTMAPSSPNW